MESHEDPPESVVEEIATILATGYIRLRKERRVAGPAPAPAIQVAEEQADSTPNGRP
jgi:hypothetical protein